MTSSDALLWGGGGSGTWGDLGALYDCAGWQAAGYDGGSFHEDHAFDASFHATSANCAALGHANAP